MICHEAMYLAASTLLISNKTLLVSHGTFGIWGALLASDTNLHVMADNLGGTPVHEIESIKRANMTNWIFMDGVDENS